MAVLDRHCRPVTNRGRRHPRLNPIGRDVLALFRAALAGEHAIVGFRTPTSPAASTPARPPTTPRPEGASNEPAGSSPSSAATVLARKLHPALAAEVTGDARCRPEG